MVIDAETGQGASVAGLSAANAASHASMQGRNLPARPRVLAFLHPNWDIDVFRKDFREGNTPDESPYGLHQGADFGFDLSYSCPTQDGLANKAFRKIAGFNLDHAVRNADLIENADVVWTTSEREYLGILFAARIGRLRRMPKMIGQTIWLFDNWATFSPVRRSFYRHLISGMSAMTVHSERYLPVIRDLCPAVPVKLIRFGISSLTFPMRPFQEREPERKIRILSAGGDVTRDWSTLCAAFGGDARFEVVIWSNSKSVDNLKSYENVSIKTSPNISEMKHEYDQADFLVIPLRNNLYSGITVSLEGTALGAPIICSDTGGVPTYFNRQEVCFVPPGDPRALRDAALAITPHDRRAMVSQAQRRFLKEDYTTAGLARRYSELSWRLLGQA